MVGELGAITGLSALAFGNNVPLLQLQAIVKSTWSFRRSIT